MSTPARRKAPRRGPGRAAGRRLPARVYWVRRLLVLGLAMGLVLGVAQLLGATVGGKGDTAWPVGAAAAPTSGPTGPAARLTPTTDGRDESPATQKAKAKQRRERSASPSPLAVPTGPCEDSDVVVTPKVEGDVYAGEPVPFSLELTTRDTPACTWEISPKSVVVRLTSGSDRIWSSQDCKAAVDTQDVVVRKDVPTSVTVTWRGQRSDGTCSRSTAWAQPGYYFVTTAAIGAEPTELQFVLRAPVPQTITPSPTPTPKKKGDDDKDDDKGDDQGGKPSGKPSPAND